MSGSRRVSTTRSIAALICYIISLIATVDALATHHPVAKIVAVTFAVAGLVFLYLPGKAWDRR